jgi:cell division protein FtsB
MSTLVDYLRDGPSQLTCDEAADEIESLEKSYALLFAENAKLRQAIDAIAAIAKATGAAA